MLYFTKPLLYIVTDYIKSPLSQQVAGLLRRKHTNPQKSTLDNTKLIYNQLYN